MTSPPPLKSFAFNPPCFLAEICLKCEFLLQQDVTNSLYLLPLPPNEKDFLLLKAQFARKYTQRQFTWYTGIFNKQLWQQNLAISMFLVKCLLLTVSFLNSRKQYEYETHRKNDSLTRKFIKNHHMAVTPVVKHTLPPPPSRNILNLLNPPRQGCHLWMAPN